MDQAIQVPGRLFDSLAHFIIAVEVENIRDQV